MWKPLDKENCYWEGLTKISLIKLHSSYKQEKERMDLLPPKYIYLCIQPQTLRKSIKKKSEAPLGNRNTDTHYASRMAIPSLVSRAEIFTLRRLFWGREAGTRGGRWRGQGVRESHGNSATRRRDYRPRPQLEHAFGHRAEPQVGRFSIRRSFGGQRNTTCCSYKPRAREQPT